MSPNGIRCCFSVSWCFIEFCFPMGKWQGDLALKTNSPKPLETRRVVVCWRKYMAVSWSHASKISIHQYPWYFTSFCSWIIRWAIHPHKTCTFVSHSILSCSWWDFKRGFKDILITMFLQSLTRLYIVSFETRHQEFSTPRLFLIWITDIFWFDTNLPHFRSFRILLTCGLPHLGFDSKLLFLANTWSIPRFEQFKFLEILITTLFF